MYLYGDPLVVSTEIERRFELAGVPVTRSGRLHARLGLPDFGITSSFRARRSAHRHRPVAGSGGAALVGRNTALTAR